MRRVTVRRLFAVVHIAKCGRSDLCARFAQACRARTHAKRTQHGEAADGSLGGQFRAADYKDEYRERVMKSIKQKARGKAPRLRAGVTTRNIGLVSPWVPRMLF